MKLRLDPPYNTVVIVFFVLAGLAVSTALFFQGGTDNGVSQSMITSNRNTNTTSTEEEADSAPLTLMPLSIDNPASLSLLNCVDSLADDDAENMDVLIRLYSDVHPELSVTDAGSYCEFSNGMKIVSYAYQTKADPVVSGQSMVVFDADNGYVNETTGFSCSTLGDLLAPHFTSLEQGIVKAYCWSSDGAISRYEEFAVDLSNFTYEKTLHEEGEDISLETMLAGGTTPQEEEPTTEAVPVTKTAWYVYNDTTPTSLNTEDEYASITTARVRKPDGITLSDIEVNRYDSPLLDTQYGNGRVSDVQCNDQYCLMTIRSAGWQYRVLRFENGTFTDISSQIPGFSAGSTGGIAFRWDGSRWMIDANTSALLYDGSSMTPIDLTLERNQKVSAIGWNGSEWLIAASTECCVHGATTLFHVNTDGTVTSEKPILETEIDRRYPVLRSVAWYDSQWVLAGNWQNDNGHNASPILLTYDGIHDPVDHSSLLSLPEDAIFQNIFSDGKRVLMHFDDWGTAYAESKLLSFDGEQMTDVSSMLKGFLHTNISTIEGRSNFYAIAGYNHPVTNVVHDGSVRDLSGYFAMRVYSGTTYGNRVFIGGESELEVLTFHYEPSRTYVSEKVNDTDHPVTSVTLIPTHQAPAGTHIAYSVSNDGGATWTAAEPRQQVTFSGSGADLRWRAVMTTTDSSITPSISFMEINYGTTE